MAKSKSTTKPKRTLRNDTPRTSRKPETVSIYTRIDKATAGYIRDLVVTLGDPYTFASVTSRLLRDAVAADRAMRAQPANDGQAKS